LRTRKAIHREKVWQAMTSTALFGRLRGECGSKRPRYRWQPLTTQVPHRGDGTWALNRTPTCTGPRSSPFRVRIEAGQCGWRRARISRRISRDANQFMFCGTAIPRSKRYGGSKRGLDMGDDWVGGWSRSTDFEIVVPGPFWRKVFSKNGLAARKGRPLRGTLEEKNQTHQGQDVGRKK